MGVPPERGRPRVAVLLAPIRRKQPGNRALIAYGSSDTFVRAFNAERPREALDMKCPAELYLASSRRYDGLPELLHPFHDLTLASTGNRSNTDDIGKARQSH